MILLIFGICILMVVGGWILGCILDRKTVGDGDICYGISGIGAIVGFFALVGLIGVGVNVKSLSVIDDRIAMYEEENTRIEQQVADVVEQYQKYETDIFMGVAPESAVTMVSLYPELKSDSLVQAQIKVYTENNKTIRDLRDKQIKGNVYRWWLYFGGGNT